MKMPYRILSANLFIMLVLCGIIYIYINTASNVNIEKEINASSSRQQRRRPDDYLRPLIFVGGHLRSGTTLMRAMLNAHPSIRCGPETMVIAPVLHTIQDVVAEFNEGMLAGGLINKEMVDGKFSILDTAVQDYILDLIINFGDTSQFYCNKDPASAYQIPYIMHLFPNCKYILMVRDLRAVAHSYISKGLHLGANTTDYNFKIACYAKLVQTLDGMYQNIMIPACIATPRCVIQKYEDLVLQPIRETKKLLHFLGIKWDEEVLYHERHLDNSTLNPKELSSKQVIKSIYLDALTDWINHVPREVARSIRMLAPSMEFLGYDVTSEYPVYGEPDDFVLKKGKWKDGSSNEIATHGNSASGYAEGPGSVWCAKKEMLV